MGVSVFPAPATGGGGYKRYVVTLTSGTSWTVPTGVTNINATLQGGGGGGSGSIRESSLLTFPGVKGQPGQMITTNVNTTPGASISYAIGGGGTGGNTNTAGGTGGSTTFTGATTAAGGVGGVDGNSAAGPVGTQAAGNDNGGGPGSPFAGNVTSPNNLGGAGGSGQIIIEYWT
jgi:hypothetical protein